MKCFTVNSPCKTIVDIQSKIFVLLKKKLLAILNMLLSENISNNIAILFLGVQA